MFNLKNKEAQNILRSMTSQDGILSDIVNKGKDVTSATKKFLKRLNGCVTKCFQKIRISEHKSDNEIINLFDERRVLRSKMDTKSRSRLREVEEALADKCAETNKQKIESELKDIESDEGGFNMAKLWKLKKSLCPYNKEPPVAMSDPCGNIITSEANLKNTQ